MLFAALFAVLFTALFTVLFTAQVRVTSLTTPYRLGARTYVQKPKLFHLRSLMSGGTPNCVGGVLETRWVRGTPFPLDNRNPKI